MTSCLVIQVRLHEGRYHGVDSWPPSPARLFQALVAGAGLAGRLAEQDQHALKWLEALDAPIVGAPRKRDGQAFTLFVPGNDLDKVGGDPRRIGEIRDGKVVRPRLFDSTVPFFYAWSYEEGREARRPRERISALAERLYQFGRGVDFAWAWAEVLDRDALDELVRGYRGTVFRPSRAGRGISLACPSCGSLESLERRYSAYPRRFAPETGQTQVFSRPPMARFVQIAYASPPARHLYELRERSSEARFAPRSPTRVSKLVTCLRDAAADRLRTALPTRSAEIDRVLIGRKPDGTNDGPASARVRIIPLPSIGHRHADRQVRRVLVEIPPDCPLRADDVHWAFSGLEVVDRDTGDAPGVALTPAQEAATRMLTHYGLDQDAVYLRWRTVTPAALPPDWGGRVKTNRERRRKLARVADPVLQALRHAAVPRTATSVAVQREPFDGGGERAEAFAPGTRFGPDRLWHIEIAFSEGVNGPLVIGDGRFLGLGVMAPVRGSEVKAADHGRVSEESMP